MSAKAVPGISPQAVSGIVADMASTSPIPSLPTEPPPLLGPGDPPPVTLVNAEGRTPLLLLCDHASNAIPAALDDLGLDASALARHIAYDIGAAEVTRGLARALDAPAVLSGYSRLIIDLNRALDDPTAIPVISDGVVVPANRTVDAAEANRRIDALFRPYHEAIDEQIAVMRGRGQTPAIVSIHSFTPVMRGFERPWHVGLLWDRDPRMVGPLLDALRADSRLVVGDNEPYTGRGTEGSTIDLHAVRAGLPYILFEIRQDLIDTHHGAAEWVEILAGPLKCVLADESLFRVQHF
jgi:predicted N-formylglutamate amidohydrolase